MLFGSTVGFVVVHQICVGLWDAYHLHGSVAPHGSLRSQYTRNVRQGQPIECVCAQICIIGRLTTRWNLYADARKCVGDQNI